MSRRFRVLALITGLIASSCCLEGEDCREAIYASAPLPTDDVVTVELCFRDLCDAVELPSLDRFGPPGRAVGLFVEGEGPAASIVRYSDHMRIEVLLDLPPATFSPEEGDRVQLRILDGAGGVLLEETRTVKYRFVGDAVRGGCTNASIAF